jgi:hypothetical protein
MRTRRCSLCRKKVEAESAVIGSLKAFCSMEHLIEFSRSAAGKKIKQSAEKKVIKETKERLKTRSDRVRDAQAAFNRYIRARDRGKPCICCGRSQGDIKHGGAVDAGHYRSRGSAPGLKFNLLNCHSQLAYCNRYLSGKCGRIPGRADRAYRTGTSREIRARQLAKTIRCRVSRPG